MKLRPNYPEALKTREAIERLDPPTEQQASPRSIEYKDYRDDKASKKK